MNRPGGLLPREHGAWGLLLQPFAAAMALAGRWTWLYLPVLGLVLCGFLVREPLVVWIRHRWIWKKASPEASTAIRYAAVLMMVIGASAAALLVARPWLPVVAFCGIGLVLTVISVRLTVKNKQRSIPLQVVSASGLTSSALLAGFAATGGFPVWTWLLWALLAAHAMAAIPIVHARLQFKARKATAPRLNAIAAGFQAALLLAAVALFFLGGRAWMPVAFSGLANLGEVLRLRNPVHLAEPVKRVGQRLLAESLVHTVLTVLAVQAS